jgi:hypothetical protein
MGVKAFPVRSFREVDQRHYRRIRGDGQRHSAPIRGSSDWFYQTRINWT